MPSATCWILLDNCADAPQVAPLLPGSSTCAVILTSRSALTSIPGAEQLQLDVPPVEESLALLAQVSRRSLTADPAWSDVVRYCGGLPLAIRIAGALDALAAKAFALLGLLELPELTARQVGPLLDRPEREAEAALERLLDLAREELQRAIALQREHGITDAGELSALLASS